MIKVNPVRSSVDEIPCYFEYVNNPKFGIEFKLGYIYSNNKLADFSEHMFSKPIFYHSGGFIGFGIKRYNKISFLQVFATYKYKDFNKKDLWLGGWGGSSWADDICLSQYLNIVNLQVLYGIHFGGKVFLEYYSGIGFNATSVKTLYHESRFGSTIPKDNGIYFSPTIHIGLKIGLQLKKENKSAH